MKNRIVSSLTREKISKIVSLRLGAKNPFYGKHHSKETIDKIKQHRLDNPIQAANSRKTSVNGVIYDSVTDAARHLGCVPASIIFRIKSKNVKFKDYLYVTDVKCLS